MSDSLIKNGFYWVKNPSTVYSAAVLVNNIAREGSNSFEFDVMTYSFGNIVSSGKIVVLKDDIIGPIFHPPTDTLRKLVDDLVDQDDNSEPSIMWNLKQRYLSDVIYSSIGPIIIALNPYKIINSITSDSLLDRMMSTNDYGCDKPHIWNIPRLCLRNISSSKKNQAVIISGESGK